MVDVAKAVGADAVSHGCTGKGNDQVIIAFGHKPLIQVQCWLHNVERIGHKLI
jgi:argininosuccinate synthase